MYTLEGRRWKDEINWFAWWEIKDSVCGCKSAFSVDAVTMFSTRQPSSAHKVDDSGSTLNVQAASFPKEQRILSLLVSISASCSAASIPSPVFRIPPFAFPLSMFQFPLFFLRFRIPILLAFCLTMNQSYPLSSSLPLSVFVSVCLFVGLSLSLYSLSLYSSIWLCICVSLFPCLSLSVPICHSLCFSLISLPFSVSISPFLCLFVSLFQSLQLLSITRS